VDISTGRRDGDHAVDGGQTRPYDARRV
jgi:hypothetical protein